MVKNGIEVLVSGASVAGLTAAHWLARYGFEVTVVERAPHLRPGGQALDIRGPGLEVARRMSLIANLRDRSTKLTGMSVVDSDGNEIFRSTERTFTGGRFDSPDIEILRDELCDVLYQSGDKKIKYLFGESIVSLNQDTAGVDVEFGDAPPRRFDLVVGADGLHSGVRKIAFGPELQFTQYLGKYIAVFPIPNFLGLDRWQVLYRKKDIFGGILGLRKDIDARTYIAFDADELLEYDHRDIVSQKRLVADRVADAGWEFPRIVAHMWQAANFHFDPLCQIRMDSWSRGRIVLVGDAGYSVSPMTGQGTTVAMVGAYTLAGELAAHRDNLLEGVASYMNELRDYVIRNQDVAVSTSQQSLSDLGTPVPSDLAAEQVVMRDFGQMVQPLALKEY
jgi:2-polyprenyl-6-methoxyphenol hydroxylase-like FAD-dependent oxidoreductase